MVGTPKLEFPVEVRTAATIASYAFLSAPGLDTFSEVTEVMRASNTIAEFTFARTTSLSPTRGAGLNPTHNWFREASSTLATAPKAARALMPSS